MNGIGFIELYDGQYKEERKGVRDYKSLFINWSVYICCDNLFQPEMIKFELWQRNMKMILKF